MDNEFIWVFTGESSRFPSGIYKDRSAAIEWIKNNGLSGVLTKYPVDTGTYEWAISKKLFSPKDDQQKTPHFIGKFTCAGMDHFHFENGNQD